MMKWNRKNTKIIVILSLLIAVAVAACASGNSEVINTANGHSEVIEKGGDNRNGSGNGDGAGNGKSVGNMDENTQGNNIAENTVEHSGDHIATVDGELTEIEIDGLLFMREEEKLAGDVYRFFYEHWGTAVFSNITSSEDEHTQAVRELMNAYDIADPTSAQIGVFQNTELQALYDQLTEQGLLSERDALLVGAAIEEIDILDLDGYIAGTSNRSIIEVYQNLRRGSENHLRAFTKMLEDKFGEIYTPVYLTSEQYEAILEGSQGVGGYGGGNNAVGNGRRGNS